MFVARLSEKDNGTTPIPVNLLFLPILPFLPLSILLWFFSTTALATEYECRSGNDVRYIRVDYPGVNHLCEVSVTSAGNQREVKWHADFESTFCSNKIIELTGKYQNQWGYTCEEWPDHDGIDELSNRQRKYLDELVQNNRNTQYKDRQYTLLGTRALLASLAINSTSSNTSGNAGSDNGLLAVQLFLGRIKSVNDRTESAVAGNGGSSGFEAIEDDINPVVANRLIIVRDDGSNYQTLSTLDDLSSLIEIDREGYLLDSVIIETLHPNGDLDVSTLVASPEDDPDSIPSCYGYQRLKRTDSSLESAGKHQIFCDL